ncbi:hypothetical protein E2F43_10780 [Seongchinamella unica]|uniref:Uncharacterized protein n=1 Tax=Seongchinamella unica TaxID=2547392 RepID=A0A4R5LSV8_9GAMM|nr:hypothetical protein [Seongchinamella unica]TDG13970.1 hypothetical protein E2F43_10780 [Seongchinamella unica]
MTEKESGKQPAPARDARGRFVRGNEIAKTGGRPLGSKHKLSESFLKDVAVSWQEQGGDVLQKVAQDDPSTYLRVIASLVPKELVTRLEAGDSAQGLVINLLGVEHPIDAEWKDITPENDRYEDS